jgi:hypothetical protein
MDPRALTRRRIPTARTAKYWRQPWHSAIMVALPAPPIATGFRRGGLNAAPRDRLQRNDNADPGWL